MTHQIKVLGAKPDDLSWIPGTHRVEGKELTPTNCSDFHCGIRPSQQQINVCVCLLFFEKGFLCASLTVLELIL